MGTASKKVTAFLSGDVCIKNLSFQLAAKENQIQRLEFDLQRLRTHLVDLEEQSTSDALMYEEREKALKEQLEQIQRDFYRSKEEK